MPTYEYECTACGHTFECFQSITEGAKRKCPVCGRLKLRRIIGAGAGVIFKGSGFYETDYKRSSAGKVSSGKKEETSKSGEDKPAAEKKSSGDTGKDKVED